MNQKKYPTVTVAVSAHNEAKNIKKFLRSILRQKEKDFSIEDIWIYSDGSTDKTVEVAESIKSKKVKIFDYKKRIGKSSRLNQIYKNLKSDFLIQTDADVIFGHDYVIKNIIQPLIKDSSVGMCGGYPIPVKGKTFTEKADACTFILYNDILKNMNGGDNVFSADGRLLAYRNELCKKIKVPEDMIANDVYTYYACITNKYKYKFVQSALVFFRAPLTLKDKVKQNLRSQAVPIRMKKYFSPKLVNKETHVPINIRLKSMILQFIKFPIKSTYIYAINKYCSIKAAEKEKYLSALWDIAHTTKRV